MKQLIVAALAAVGLGGCVAVPAPYYGETAYYAAPPVGVYVAPPHRHGWRSHHRHRHHRGHHHRR